MREECSACKHADIDANCVDEDGKFVLLCNKLSNRALRWDDAEKVWVTDPKYLILPVAPDFYCDYWGARDIDGDPRIYFNETEE
jgi:hypothetical protein